MSPHLWNPGLGPFQACHPHPQTCVSFSCPHSILEDYKYIQCGVYPQQSSVTTVIKSYRWRVALAPHPKDIVW